MEKVDLYRYELTGLLGSGADYEVRSAIDRETGDAVVIKRPVPQMISRKMHGPVDERTERTIHLHGELANGIPGVCPMVGHAELANHDGFFGDSLEQEYRVTISQRAAGIPLVGDPMARILRVPIGAGQNLFCLHPLCFSADDDQFPVQRQILDAQERFHAAGYVLLDLGPQNIFFSPGQRTISIIDPGALLTAESDRTPGSRGPQDIHDFYLEMLKFYCVPEAPPSDVAGYRDPVNLRPVVNFQQEIDELSHRVTSSPDSSVEMKDAWSGMAARVRNREYQGYSEFKADYLDYLEALRQRNGNRPDLDRASEIWKQATELLYEDHWKKYDFDAISELAGFKDF
ncbi:MAG: hypothetical protein F4X65_14575 [Chloroflexi bacterium]|nr:hypothetical protein [Chloroflexota bacterium]